MGHSPSEHQPATACGSHCHQLLAKHCPHAHTPQQPHSPSLSSPHAHPWPHCWAMYHLPCVLQGPHVVDIEDNHDGWGRKEG